MLLRIISLVVGFFVVTVASSAATVVHTYSGVAEDDASVSLTGWFTIDENTTLLSNSLLHNSDILALSFTIEGFGSVDESNIEVDDFTILSGGTTGTVSGGSGGFVNSGAFTMTLYGSGGILSFSQLPHWWFNGTWSSYIGDPPLEPVSAVPLPASAVFFLTGLAVFAFGAWRSRVGVR